jgi:CHAT domain-containing protein
MPSRRRKPTRAAAAHRSERSGGRRNAAGTNGDFPDFVIQGRRRSAALIEVRVASSPAGAMPTPVRVAFPDAEGRRLRESFHSATTPEGAGRMFMDVKQATEIGKRLARILLRPPVFALLAESLATVRGKGLRVRLALDESLIDLPWEYVYRPDRLDAEGVSGFLLYDPTISLVRLAANPRVDVEPIRGAAQLRFVGAFWERGQDVWQVGTEFARLHQALRPVSQFISPSFETASELDVRGGGIPRDTAIFHYGGHCDIDADGRGFLVRERPSFEHTRETQIGAARKIYADDLARALERTKVRVVVLSACNSGFWQVVRPLIAAGIPVVIGVNGSVQSTSTIEFCARFYESLALGLNLDEAVDRARRAVMAWGARHNLFDWGLYMVYMASPRAVLFPRTASPAVEARQTGVRKAHKKEAAATIERARKIDKLNFADIISETTKRRVLILGRFSERRLRMLEVLKDKLAKHPKRYIPELFTYERPEDRDLIESIVAFGYLARFVIADITEATAVQAELQEISKVQSLAIVPIIANGEEEFTMFRSNISRRPNVVRPTLRYRDENDLKNKLDPKIVRPAEAMRREMVPTA